MFSIFKKASVAQDVILRDLSEDQLNQVSGGNCSSSNDSDSTSSCTTHKKHTTTTTTKNTCPGAKAIPVVAAIVVAVAIAVAANGSLIGEAAHTSPIR